MREQPAEQSGDGGKPRRRQRYRGKYPRRFEQRHKELAGEAAMLEHVRSRRRTPAGTHLPVLLAEALDALRPQAGEIVIDCTVGYGGHAAAFAQTVLPGGRLIGLDVDAAELDRTANRLKGLSLPIRLHHANYAGIDKVLAQEGLDGADILFADLGVSSMQIDDPSRGMSYKHDDAPLDMRMDARRPRSAADLLNSLSQEELSQALWELADEPDHEKIAEWIVRQREVAPSRRPGSSSG
jgi:16S rRNA (cytosine1402-N4)-methyltransferase